MKLRWYFKKGESSPTLQYLYMTPNVWQDVEEVYEEGWFEKDQEFQEGE